MPRIYDNPKEKSESPGETRVEHERHSVGSGPGGPTAVTENRATMIAIIVVLAIVLVIALLRVARGENMQVGVNPPERSDIIYHQVTPPAVTKLVYHLGI